MLIRIASDALYFFFTAMIFKCRPQTSSLNITRNMEIPFSAASLDVLNEKLW